MTVALCVWYSLGFTGLKYLFVPFADTPQTYIDRGTVEKDAGPRKACRFSRSLLGSCSGENDPYFGFKEGKPCIIVKLNRIVNFRPKVGLLRTYKIIAFVITSAFALIRAQ